MSQRQPLQDPDGSRDTITVTHTHTYYIDVSYSKLLHEQVRLEQRISRARRLRSSPPGAWLLQQFAQRLCSPATYWRVLEPTISDLAEEHALALADRRPWRARCVRWRGYWSFWAAVAAYVVGALWGKFSKLWARSRE